MLEKDITAAITRYLKTVPHCFFFHGPEGMNILLPKLAERGFTPAE